MRWKASPALAVKSAAVSLMVSTGASARSARIDPAPRSNTPAAEPSGLTTPWSDEVMRADLIWPGVHVGCAAFTRADTPVACGADIEVPAIAW